MVRCALTTKAHLRLFQPLLVLRQFLHYVTRGEHEAVQAILEKNPYLITQRSKVTDCSGRMFTHISGFEYALWALDKHMWVSMLTCIPQNEHAKTLFTQLLALYHHVKSEGVTYTFQGKVITETHFDFENTLIKELQIQVSSNQAPWTTDLEIMNMQWREGVGGAQKLLPMHVVAEYCSNTPFHPVPEFISKPISSKKTQNRLSQQEEDWFGVDTQLSIDFAVCKGNRDCAQRAHSAIEWIPTMAAPRDLIAMQTLYTVRVNDLIALKDYLEEQKEIINHQQLPRCN